MTKEQIKQIAEEYAHRNNSNPNPPYCHEEELTKRLTEAFMAGAQYISEHYCIAEKSKVVEMYQQVQGFYEDSKENYWAGQADFCEELFGSETFNKQSNELRGTKKNCRGIC